MTEVAKWISITGLEGIPGGHLVESPAPRRIITVLSKCLSNWLLKTSMDGDYTISLGNLFQCLTTLTVGKFFLISNLHFSCCKLKLLTCCLWPPRTVNFLFFLSSFMKYNTVVQLVICGLHVACKGLCCSLDAASHIAPATTQPEPLGSPSLLHLPLPASTWGCRSTTCYAWS